LVQDGDAVSIPPAKTAGAKPDEMLCDVLRQLIQELRVEIDVISKRQFCAGKNA
jgi:hypothetical protein